jgi:hypothetical protein
MLKLQLSRAMLGEHEDQPNRDMETSQDGKRPTVGRHIGGRRGAAGVSVHATTGLACSLAALSALLVVWRSCCWS